MVWRGGHRWRPRVSTRCLVSAVDRPTAATRHKRGAAAGFASAGGAFAAGEPVLVLRGRRSRPATATVLAVPMAVREAHHAQAKFPDQITHVNLKARTATTKALADGQPIRCASGFAAQKASWFDRKPR